MSEMEKSAVVAVTNDEKVSNYIPEDLAFYIISKLPLKSLKRFGCICKSWALLFENPHFMNKYRNNFISNNHSYYDDTYIVLHQSELTYEYHYHSEFYLLPNERFENRVKLDWPPPFQNDDTDIYILGSASINGILCLKQGFLYSTRVVLWNPATDEFKVIPPSPVDYVLPPYRAPWFLLHGFGYDHVRDDYKVIQFVDFHVTTCEDEDVPQEDRSYDPLFEIYSLRSNTWRKLRVDMPNCYDYTPLRGNGVYLDGVGNWCGRSELDNAEECLVSFDFINEVLYTTLMPSDMDGFGFVERHIVMLNGSIALISNYLNATTFHISILGELGVRESWIKLFIVGPLPVVKCPIGVGRKGEIVFQKIDDELAYVNLSTQMIEELGVKGNRFYCHMGMYKESFLPIRGINN